MCSTTIAIFTTRIYAANIEHASMDVSIAKAQRVVHLKYFHEFCSSHVLSIAIVENEKLFNDSAISGNPNEALKV